MLVLLENQESVLGLGPFLNGSECVILIMLTADYKRPDFLHALSLLLKHVLDLI